MGEKEEDGRERRKDNVRIKSNKSTTIATDEVKRTVVADPGLGKTHDKMTFDVVW